MELENARQQEPNIESAPAPIDSVLRLPLPERREIRPLLASENFAPDRARLEALIDAACPVLPLDDAALKAYGFNYSMVMNEKYCGYASNMEKATLDQAAGVLPPQGIDMRTINYIELHRIWETMTAETGLLGRAAISHSFLRPATSEPLIKAKQDAFREILSNKELREGISALVTAFNKDWEAPLVGFLKDGWDFTRYGYSDFQQTRSAMLNLVKRVESLPAAKSEYVKVLLDDITALKDTRTFALFNEGIYKTAAGLKPGSEKSEAPWGSRFLPWSISPFVIYSTLPAFSLFAGSLYYGFQSFGNFLFAGICCAGFVANLNSMVTLKNWWSQRDVAQPMKQLADGEPGISKALGAVGRLGELVSGARFLEGAKVPLTFPRISESSNHFFSAREMRSPLFIADPGYVPSDMRIRDQGLTFITGPNSGGKTTVARALLLNQHLAQLGMPIPAREAEFGIADLFAYQVPEFNAQGEGEGRFGTELKRTRDIIYRAGAKSFIVLDELAEGTTAEEKARYSRAILEALAIKGSSVVLITHNLELANLYQKLGIGNFLQVEFVDGNPTHRIVPGISTSSHAERVAQKIGFSIEDIKRHLLDGEADQSIFS
jgi:hypothetical protein